MIYSTYEEFQQEIKKEKKEVRLRKIFEEKIIIEEIDRKTERMNQKEKLNYYLEWIKKVENVSSSKLSETDKYQKVKHWISYCYIDYFSELQKELKNNILEVKRKKYSNKIQFSVLKKVDRLLNEIQINQKKEEKIKRLNEIISNLISYRSIDARRMRLSPIQIQFVIQTMEMYRKFIHLDII